MTPQELGVFLFTDVVGSTRLWAEHEESMRADLLRHDEVLRPVGAANDGEEFANAGDSFGFRFANVADAVRAAVESITGLDRTDWAVPGGLHIRIGVDVGRAHQRAGNWFGPALNETARIAAVAHGGQIVVSDAVVRDAPSEGDPRGGPPSQDAVEVPIVRRPAAPYREAHSRWGTAPLRAGRQRCR